MNAAADALQPFESRTKLEPHSKSSATGLPGPVYSRTMSRSTRALEEQVWAPPPAVAVSNVSSLSLASA